jgi:hypothetical protein
MVLAHGLGACTQGAARGVDDLVRRAGNEVSTLLLECEILIGRNVQVQHRQCGAGEGCHMGWSGCGILKWGGVCYSECYSLDGNHVCSQSRPNLLMVINTRPNLLMVIKKRRALCLEFLVYQPSDLGSRERS